MKKKLLAIGLAVAVLAVTIVGMSIAYFTDTDNETNTFTVGNVHIQLNEQERQLNADGSTILGNFTQNKPLFPIVGSAQGEKDEFGLPTAANYVDKVITIKNTGASDAFIRAYFAIPAALDDGYETFNAGLNILHFNFGNKVENGNVYTTFGTEWIWKNSDDSWKYFVTEIDGIAYNVYYADYYQPLAPNGTTERFVDGVYLDAGVDFDDNGNMTITRNGVTTTVDLGGIDLDRLNCPVFAIACQDAGFDNAEEAFTAAFGANYDPWHPDTPWVDTWSNSNN
ncbi:MAG: CalY family protein [Clostridium sp.]|nr:CalY family protein [Clostridium sp.]